jgi:hypothetical protein
MCLPYLCFAFVRGWVVDNTAREPHTLNDKSKRMSLKGDIRVKSSYLQCLLYLDEWFRACTCICTCKVVHAACMWFSIGRSSDFRNFGGTSASPSRWMYLLFSSILCVARYGNLPDCCVKFARAARYPRMAASLMPYEGLAALARLVAQLPPRSPGSLAKLPRISSRTFAVCVCVLAVVWFSECSGSVELSAVIWKIARQHCEIEILVHSHTGSAYFAGALRHLCFPLTSAWFWSIHAPCY